MPLTLQIFFLLVNFHIYQELIFEKNLQKYLILMSLRALDVIEIFKFLQAISPAGRILSHGLMRNEPMNLQYLTLF